MLKGRLKRLQRRALGGLEGFELLDGSTHYYNPMETYAEMFLYQLDVEVGRSRPEPPEIYQKMCEAKDPAAVLARFKPESPDVAFVNPAALFDEDALVDERRLVSPAEEGERGT